MEPAMLTVSPARITYLVVPSALRPAVSAKWSVSPSVTPRTTLLPMSGMTVKRDLAMLLKVGEGLSLEARWFDLLARLSWMPSVAGASVCRGGR
jgi:hypothetical protein